VPAQGRPSHGHGSSSTLKSANQTGDLSLRRSVPVSQPRIRNKFIDDTAGGRDRLKLEKKSYGVAIEFNARQNAGGLGFALF
jgi:hypothetical protein